MKSEEEREALILGYIELDRRRNAAKGNRWFDVHPLDGECVAAWTGVVEAFDGDRSAASEALYDMRDNRKPSPYKPPPPPKPRAAPLLQVAGHKVELAATESFPPSPGMQAMFAANRAAQTSSVGPYSAEPKSRVSQAPSKRGGSVVRDPRIPPPGTTIYKRDRHGAVLAEAIVREDGIEYAGTVYKSPSAAGLAASIAIGGAKTAIDGYTFWGLNPPKEKR